MAKGKSYPKPSGPEVEFYLGANAQYDKGERIPIHINGYDYEAVVGSRNKLPKEVVEVLQNAKSQTKVVDLERYDPSKGGVPRKEKDFYNPATGFVYQSEWDVEILKEHGK